MSEWMINPQFEEQLIEAFAVPPIRPEFVETLHRRIQRKVVGQPWQHKRTAGFIRRPAWAITLAVLTLILAVTLIIGPAKVYAAFLRLFGYIPGVGVVEQGTEIRILAEPVQITRDGITVSVNQVVLTASETKLDYGVAGVPLSAYSRDESAVGCMDRPYLRLTDGTRIDVINEEPIPAQVNEAVFVLPCIQNSLPDTVPTDWQLPLKFIPAPPDFVILPVQEVSPQATIPATESNLSGTLTPESTVEQAGAQVSVEKVIETEDGYILVGKIKSLNQGTNIEQSGALVLRDAEGNNVSSTFVNDINEYELMDVQPGEIAYSFQFKAAGVVFPLSITIPGIELSIPEPDATTDLIFSAGENPQPGQEWTLNQTFTLAGHTLMLESVSASSQFSYNFKFKGDGQVYGLGVEIEGHPGMGGGGGGGMSPENQFFRSVAYQTLPGGDLKLILSHLVLSSEKQFWTTQWQPQNQPQFEVSAVDKDICWNIDSYPSIPEMTAGLDGLVVLTQLNPQVQLVLANFHGEVQQVLAVGGSRAALSADGLNLAYESDEGIILLNRESGESTALQNNHGYNVHWSTDGNLLAFVNPQEQFGIFVSNREGSNQRQLTNLGYESIAGWSLDSSQVYYAIPSAGPDGFQLMFVDVNSGTTQELFLLENSSLKAPMPALSPDGLWVAYRAMDNSSLYIKAMDGSSTRLLLDQPGIAINGIAWDKGGHLLGVSIMTENNQDGEIIILAPDSCETYRIPGLSGQLDGVVIP